MTRSRRRTPALLSFAPKRFAAGLLGALALLLPAGSVEGAYFEPRLLEYRIAWNGIPAATATVTITADEFAGDLGYVVETAAQTNRFVDLLWSYRGRARTTFLASGLRPLRFSYDSMAGGESEVSWIDFDLGSERAKSVHIRKGRRRDFEIDSSDVVDPITTTFRAITAEAAVGDSLRYHVFTGKTHYFVHLTVLGEEEIEVPAGRFRALKVEPEVWKLKDEMKPDKRVRKITAWVANDPSRTLLRIRSDVMIGSVSLDLQTVEPLPLPTGLDEAAVAPFGTGGS